MVFVTATYIFTVNFAHMIIYGISRKILCRYAHLFMLYTYDGKVAFIYFIGDRNTVDKETFNKVQ